MKSKRIIVCNTIYPFITGGSELFANKLVDEFNKAGHEAMLLTMPFFPDFEVESIKRASEGWRYLDLTNFADVVIPLRFPTWYVKHPNKIIYLNHQMRVAYDLYNQSYGPKHSVRASQAAQLVRRIDRHLQDAKKIFAVSKNVQTRLKQYNGLDSELLYHSLPNEQLHYPGDYGGYILSVGRLIGMKRVDLLIKAMAYTKTDVRCVVVGEGEERANLEKLIEQLGISHKVKLKGWVPEKELIDLYAGSLGSFYAPVDEDYGLVTFESFKSAKPILTTPDSGGVLEFVKDRVNGFVLPHSPKQFAEAIDQLYLDRSLAQTMGVAGMKSVQHITWKNCIAKLEEYL